MRSVLILGNLTSNQSQERGIDGEKVIEYISESKDVDGLTTITAGKLSRGEVDFFIPSSPRACMELISRADLDLTGKAAVVLGRCKVRLYLIQLCVLSQIFT